LVTAETSQKGGDKREDGVAVPTAHAESVQNLAREVTALYCANIRWGWSFAVADAYQTWSDVSEEMVLKELQSVTMQQLPCNNPNNLE